MHVSYNLRYQKSNFSSRVLIDKEGEIIIYEKGFRLKGKGAGDKGEMINFSEIKEFYYRNDKIFFITFNKEKYTLCEAGSLFENLLTDLYRSRNEFLMDALFMKSGKLVTELEASFERLSKFGKLISKGHARLRLHEESLVVLPDLMDGFSLNFNFVNFHEFDDLEYKLKMVMDGGQTIFFSNLGNEFAIFEEKMNSALGDMYDTLVNESLKNAFPQFHAATLLKLAYKMKGGKAVSLHDIGKMDDDLLPAVEEFVFGDEIFKEKFDSLRALSDEYQTYVGIARDYTVEEGFVRWVMVAIPENNVVAFSMLPRWSDKDNEGHGHDTYFYKIIMEKGSPSDKIESKVQEIQQALVNLKFVKDPCYKDKRDLRHSPYQYAIRKMPFLRILRKSYVGMVKEVDTKNWIKKSKELLEAATLKK